jgi:hypothetical protein
MPPLNDCWIMARFILVAIACIGGGVYGVYVGELGIGVAAIAIGAVIGAVSVRYLWSQFW